MFFFVGCWGLEVGNVIYISSRSQPHTVELNSNVPDEDVGYDSDDLRSFSAKEVPSPSVRTWYGQVRTILLTLFFEDGI